MLVPSARNSLRVQTRTEKPNHICSKNFILSFTCSNFFWKLEFVRIEKQHLFELQKIFYMSLDLEIFYIRGIQIGIRGS